MQDSWRRLGIGFVLVLIVIGGGAGTTASTSSRQASSGRDHAGTYVYNPESSFQLEVGTTLIVLGETDDVTKLKSHMGVC